MSSLNVSPEMRKMLSEKDRMMVLRDLALIDAEEEPVFNRLTRLASKIVGTLMSMLSMVGGDYQFFKSAYGVDYNSTPLSHAFCKHVVVDDAPLVVDDARVHPVLFDNGSVKDHNVAGYLGFPVKMANGKTLGSFCVVDNQPHQWTELDFEIMRELTEIVKYEIEVRALVHAGSMTQAQLDALHGEIFTFADRISTDQPKEAIAKQIRAERLALFGEWQSG